jgi:hypothetical protein
MERPRGRFRAVGVVKGTNFAEAQWSPHHVLQCRYVSLPVASDLAFNAKYEKPESIAKPARHE